MVANQKTTQTVQKDIHTGRLMSPVVLAIAEHSIRFRIRHTRSGHVAMYEVLPYGEGMLRYQTQYERATLTQNERLPHALRKTVARLNRRHHAQ